MADNYVIIGTGPAGISAAESIRAVDPQAHITLLTDEPYPFYSRPGIAYILIDMVSDQQVISRRADYYRKMRFKLMTSTRAKRIDPDLHLVHLENGGTLAYDKLLIATGAAATPPTVFPGGDLDGAIVLDTLDDARDIVQRSRRAQRAVVVGGGITAMEAAEGLAHQGVETHYLLRKDTLWSNLLNRIESRLIEQHILAHGVRLHFNEEIAEILGEGGRVAGVRLKSGNILPAEIVAVCIGVRPQLKLLEGTNVQTDRGILVDEYLQTSVEGIYAAGDCAQIFDRWSGKHLLDALWPTAIASGRVAGYNMAGQRYRYAKGVAFNAALLFGVHLTAIGQVGAGLDRDADEEELSSLSRGSSEAWLAQAGAGYGSAWDDAGMSTRRLVFRDDHIVGALLLGNQDLADPLRDLIEYEVNIREEKAYLMQGGKQLEKAILHAHRRWQESRSQLQTDR